MKEEVPVRDSVGFVLRTSHIKRLNAGRRVHCKTLVTLKLPVIVST